MTNNHIIYLLLKIYDTLLTIYVILTLRMSLIYKNINKKIYQDKNIVYIFQDKNYLCKKNYSLFIKMIEIKEYNLENKNNFFIHQINYLDITYISNNKLLNNNNFKKTNFTFILVEIINSNYTIDITNFLNNVNSCYYIINNNLFDKNFIIWLQYNKFNIENNYKINIIDNNINTIQFDKNKYIKLLADSYNIIEI